MTKNDKPPYLIGLLCVLPLIGAFVGIFMIFYGLFRYKDKLFTGIGVFGVLFTVCVYSFLIYSSKLDQPTKNDVLVTQGKINTLVREIEMYKLEHGFYPEKLVDLETSQNIGLIDDPIMMHFHGEKLSTLFEYHNLGKKYKLYSRGLDQVAGTSDDIYPDLNDGKNITFGFYRSPDK